MDGAKRSAFKLAFSEFCIMFVVTVVWNFARKTNWNLWDELAIAAITALFVYVSALK
jgi:hypothetical protein